MDEKKVQILDAPPALPKGAHWYRGPIPLAHGHRPQVGQELIFHAFQTHRSACDALYPLLAVGVERAIPGSAYCIRCCEWAKGAVEFHSSVPQAPEDEAVVLPAPPPLLKGIDWLASIAAIGTGPNGQPVALEPTFHAVPEVRADGVHKDALCGQPRPRYPHQHATRSDAVKRKYCAVCLRFADITVPTHFRDKGFMVRPPGDPFSRYPQVLRSEQPNEFHQQFNETIMRSSRIQPDKYGMVSSAGRWSASELQMQSISRVQLQRYLWEEQHVAMPPEQWPHKYCLRDKHIPQKWRDLLLEEPRPAGHVQSWYQRYEGSHFAFYGRPKDPAMRHVRVTPEQIAYAVRDDNGWPVAPEWGRLRDIIQTAFFEYHPDNPPAKKPSKKEQNFFWSPEDQADTIAKDQVYEP